MDPAWGPLLHGLDRSSALFGSHFSICRVKMRSASQTGHEGVGLLQGVQVPGKMPDPSLLPRRAAVQLGSLTEPPPEQ